MTDEEKSERLLFSGGRIVVVRPKFIFHQEKMDYGDDHLDHLCGMFNNKWFERGMQYL